MLSSKFSSSKSLKLPSLSGKIPGYKVSKGIQAMPRIPKISEPKLASPKMAMPKVPSVPGIKHKKHRKNWIAGAIKHPGALHRELGVPEGKKISTKKLNAAAKKGGKVGKRARLAETLKKLKHKTMAKKIVAKKHKKCMKKHKHTAACK